jgi:hypothetical protein
VSALETLQWYDGRVGERSDELVIAENKRFELVEKRPAPLNLTDTEILDFLGEYCEGYKYESACSMLPARFVIQCYGMEETSGKTLREAACLAAAKFEEANS